MLIKKNAYYKLVNNCPHVPPETGGILMGVDSIIDTIIFDPGRKGANDSTIKYIPDAIFLNKCLSILHSHGKKFLGMFHTHAHQWDYLSKADISYIEKIMETMPTEIEILYFPIVYPKEYVKSYKATKNFSQIIISSEEIELL